MEQDDTLFRERAA